jgi:hypothetical protein
MTDGMQVAGSGLGAVGVDAFLYGFPLVLDLNEVGRFAREGIGAVPATPYNEFGHATQLAGPETRFVSVNNDTVYSIANVDVSGGPVGLDVRTRRVAITCFSSSTRGRTTSPMSATARPVQRPGPFFLSDRTGRVRCRVVYA